MCNKCVELSKEIWKMQNIQATGHNPNSLHREIREWVKKYYYYPEDHK